MIILRRVFAFVLVLALVSVFIGLGLWQLRRNDEKRTFNARLLERSTQPIPPVEDLFTGRGYDVRYRAARATGTYDTAREIVISGRALRSVAGNHILTPLRLPDGRALLVDRGWVPLGVGEPPVEEAPVPSGTVNVEGVLLPSEVRARLGPTLRETGTLTTAPRVDVARFAKQLPYEVLPLWLHLRAQQPPHAGEFPKAVDLPTRDAGPHLSYAIQWFLFAAVTVIGFTALAIRQRKKAGLEPARAESL